MGVKERKEREKLQRANDILEAARRSFEAKGFLNTTLQDVAKEAEISVGLIYRYFQSKEDIFASLALKGARELDAEIEAILKRSQGKRKIPVAQVLEEVATAFFDFYSPYGEYFDTLIYTYKGLKEVQIQATTVTSLMSATLMSLDRIKEYILQTPAFGTSDEDEALRIVFLLWGILLGAHKLFDSSGRGHLFAFRQDDFLKQMIDQILHGIAPVVPRMEVAGQHSPIRRLKAREKHPN